MDLNAVEQLKEVLSSITIEKDQIIYEEGEPLGDGYILSLGRVQLFKNTSDGKLAKKQIINSMQVFGVWNSILGNKLRLFTAKASQKSSALIIQKLLWIRNCQPSTLLSDCFLGKHCLIAKISAHCD